MCGGKVSVDAGSDESQADREVHKVAVEVLDDEVFYPVVNIYQTEAVEPLETKEAKGADETESKSEPQSVLTDVVKKIDEPERRGARKWWSRAGTLVTTILAALAIVLVGLRLAGFRTFTVMSGSMDPEYPVGSLIYV